MNRQERRLSAGRAESQNEPPHPPEVVEMAHRVTSRMATGVEGPSGQERRVYDDGKLRVLTGINKPHISIHILRNPGNTMVFEVEDGEWQKPRRYHPGRWVQHLEKLDAEARQIEDRTELERFRKAEEEGRHSFGPIDDSDIFELEKPNTIIRYITAIRITVEVERYGRGYLAVFRPNAGAPVSHWGLCPQRAVETVRLLIISRCLNARGGINREDPA